MSAEKVVEPVVAPVTAPVAEPVTAPVEKPLAIQADWPSDWRDKMAGDDKDFRKQLDRFNAPGDVGKSWKEITGKVSAGEYKKAIPFPKDGTPEQQAAWRTETGIPDSPDKYDLKFDNGLIIGDEDKPYVDQFLQKVHGANLPPEAVKTAVAAYFEMQQEAAAKAVEDDRAFQAQQEEVLRQKWGPEYLPNKNLAEDFVVTRFGPDIGKAIMQAGPEAVEAVAAIARELNPAMTLVPNASDPNAAIAGELEGLQKIMGTPEWYGSPQKQARYLQLIEGQARMRK